jgi:protease IV
MHKLSYFPYRYLLSIVCCLLFLSGCIYNISLLPPIKPFEEKKLSGKGKDKIVLLDLTGIITDQQKQRTLFIEPSMVSEMKEKLDTASKDPMVKAVVLRINSPGGTVTASDLLYHEIINFKKTTGKKVISVIMDLGASGGYYVAAASDKILAHPTTVTGSIGVIMININVEGLLEKIGVTEDAIKSGEKKDMGSPFRSMSEEERKIFQEVIDQMYERFISVVAEGRKNLTKEQLRKIADGRIYTAQQAVALGLVDRIGYLEDAISIAQEETGLKEARVVTYQRPGSYKANIYSGLPANRGNIINMIQFDLSSMFPVGTPQFMYLWVP